MADNPNAFPITDAGQIHPGMTLRDWFAGQALSQVLEVMRREPAFDPERSLLLAAKGAYIIADALLDARKVQS